MLKSKFISNVLSVGGVCSCVATMSCSAKEETKKEIVFKNNSIKFRDLKFDSIGELIDYLIQLVKRLSIALFNNPGDKSISERLESARYDLSLIQNMKEELRSEKEYALKEFEKLREDNVIRLGTESRKDCQAYKQKLWDLAKERGFSSISYSDEEIFNNVFRESGIFNYKFRVPDFAKKLREDAKTVFSYDSFCYMALCSLEINDIGITLEINAGSRPFKESVCFWEENSREKISNIVNKVKILNYIFSRLELCERYMWRGGLFFSEKVDDDGNVVFSPKTCHNVVLKDDASNAVKRVSSLVFKPCGEFEIGFADEEQTQKCDITNIEDLGKLKVLMDKFEIVDDKTQSAINAGRCVDSVA